MLLSTSATSINPSMLSILPHSSLFSNASLLHLRVVSYLHYSYLESPLHSERVEVGLTPRLGTRHQPKKLDHVQDAQTRHHDETGSCRGWSGRSGLLLPGPEGRLFPRSCCRSSLLFTFSPPLFRFVSTSDRFQRLQYCLLIWITYSRLRCLCSCKHMGFWR